jgi:two-component system sensor kinase FixL
MSTEAWSEAPQTDEQRSRVLIEAVTDYAIYMLDPHGIVTSWNAGAQRFKGYTPDEIIAEHFSRFYTEEDRQTDLPSRALETAAREGRFEQEGWRVRKDGSRFWAHVVIDPIRDEQGTLIGFAKITRDITERREAQQALEATRMALFQSQTMETMGQLKRAEERERELQAELLHVSRLAAMGQIASIIAHELNQPLAAIVNYVEGCRSLLESSEITDAGLIRDALAQVAQQALHAGQILRRVRGFIGRRSCERERVNIADLLHQASTLAIVGAKPNGSTASVRSTGASQFVVGDKTQLQQVVFNLVRNAVEAMQESERRELLIATASSGNNLVEVSIADTGPGIDEEIRSRLFEPFVTTKRHGMGIGLSLCRTIIEAHGGQLWAEPGPNGGTVFRFTLPVISDVE